MLISSISGALLRHVADAFRCFVAQAIQVIDAVNRCSCCRDIVNVQNGVEVPVFGSLPDRCRIHIMECYRLASPSSS